MKFTMKRSVACLLLVCMLLTILPFAAFAEGEPAADNKIVFDFTGLEGTTFEGYEKDQIGRNWLFAHSSYGPLVPTADYLQYGPEIKPTFYLWEYRFWAAITLQGIPAGEYNVKLDLAENTGKTCPVEFYIVPRSSLPKINTSGPMGKMNSESPVITFDGNKTEVSVPNLQLPGDSKDEYLIMFNFLPAEESKELESLTDTTIKLKTITFEKVQRAPKPTAPAATTPADNAGADKGSFPVVPVVIAAVAVVAVAAVVIVVLKKKKSA